uniref:Uncharacterized protein n=1 Tax=Oryza meridionalis TaxID=40149 RepID=A0A0E0EV02_9ORYZ
MCVDGEHVMLPASPRFGHRRAGALLALSSLSLGCQQKRRRKKTGGRRRRRKRKVKTDRVILEFLPKPGVQSYKLVFFQLSSQVYIS